jgi:hypothetical protein
MAPLNNPPKSGKIENSPKSFFVRYLLAALLCLFTVAYTCAAVFGIIPKERQIDATNVVIIAIAAICSLVLINPNFLERLRRLKLAGFELEVDKIKQKQEQQQGQLEAISLLLPLVLTEAEGKHLQNLAENTAAYTGNHEVRSGLLKLRTMGLIRNLPDQHIASIKDNLRIDIGGLVELTPFGRRLLQQLRQIEKAKQKSED